MAKKKIEVVTKGSVKHEGEYQKIGATIKLDQDEAERLIGLGAVELPRPKLEAGQDPGEKSPTMKAAELIEKIRAVETLEELKALVPEGETRKTVVEAASARWEELEAAGK